MKPLILIPSYNRPRMLREALSGIRDMTYDYRKCEVVVLDDGSDFDVDLIVERSFGPNNSIKIIKMPSMPVSERIKNNRQCKLLNDAIFASDADFFVVNCDDDVIHPKHIENTRRFFLDNPDVMYAYGPCMLFDREFEKEPVDSEPHGDYKKPISGAKMIDTCQLAIRTKVFTEDLKYREGIFANYDQFLLEDLNKEYGLCQYMGHITMYKGVGGHTMSHGIKAKREDPGAWIKDRESSVYALQTDRFIKDLSLITASEMYWEEPRTEKVSVIVLSYNRPRMLAEALASCKDADQIIIIDDGSDFDVRGVAQEVGIVDKTSVIMAPRVTIEEKLAKPRLGKMMNYAINEFVKYDLVTYLCDDDIFEENWLKTVKTWMAKRPDCHVAKGFWGYFKDGEPIDREARCFLGGRGITTGNIVHRLVCFHKENIKWPEHTMTSIDNLFLWKMFPTHNTWMIPNMMALAGFRRIHGKALATYSEGHQMEVEHTRTQFTDEIHDITILKERIGETLTPEGIERLKNEKWLE